MMRYSPKAPLYAAVLAALGMSGGCEKGNDAVQPASQLETVVHASSKVDPEKKRDVDLSRPENPVKYFFEALNMPDATQGHNLYMRVSRDKEFSDYNKWERDRGKIKFVNFQLTKSEMLSDRRCLVLGEGVIFTVDGKKVEKQVKMHTTYNGSEWVLEDK